MNAPQYEVAEVIYRFLLPLRKNLSLHQLRTLSALERCRTPIAIGVLGMHLDACDNCGQVRISYNSCRNRHYPKCQGVNKVIDYLARYSHRVALTNHRIKNITDTEVTFEYKDYKENAKKKLMVLEGREF